MSIIVDDNTRVVVQGITGTEGTFHTRQMVEYGTKVVAGVTPGKGGQKLDGVPVFNTAQEAVEETGANSSAIFVPPPFAADAIMEAAEAGVEVVVCLTEGIPTLDMIAARQYLKGKNTTLIGPNTPGIISPGKCKIGVMAGYIHREGKVGVASRSGTLTYEVVDQLSKLGIGQSTCVGIGGDPIIGLSFLDIIHLFEADSGTDAVIIIGEIGGRAEEEAAHYFRRQMTKPVVAFIAGITAPPGRRMGHAGAIISGGVGSAQEKINTLEEAGITVVKSPAEVGCTVAETMEKKR
ncbi:MAG: succinate--CoA ligase subunit alpha [Deltaproteobacteria bacterium]|nr:MAG: succinate--CoA ligase subunit alpha [Deltaproteobacteria bacterium]